MRNLVCGWLDGGVSTPDPPAVLGAMTARIRSGVRSGDLSHCEGAWALWARCLPGMASIDERLAVAAWGELDFAGSGFSSTSSPADALAHAYQRHGSAVLARLRGPFACVILDRRAHEALIAIDRLGAFTMSYATVPGHGLVFASTADAVQAHPAAHSRIDAQALYHYLYFHMVPSPGCIFAGQRKLMPGQYLHWRNGRCEVGTYWAPAFTESLTAPIAQLEEQTRTVLRDAVGRVASRPAPGCFLSGGIDSSTVTGMLSTVIGAPVKTYTIGFDAASHNEARFARIAARHFGAAAHEYFISPGGVVEALPRISACYDEPFGNSSALPTYYCARLARDDGTTTLLAGDGGDELFGGNVRYLKQLVFDAYFRIPAYLRRPVLEAPFRRLPWLRRLPGPAKVHRYVEQALMPMPQRLESFNFFTQHPPEEILHPELAAVVDRDGPLTLLRSVYNAPERATMLNRMLFLDWKQTLADNDLRKVQGMCALAGIDARFPFLDDAVIDLSTRVPSRLKIRRMQLRHFFKRAMRDVLPREVLAKSKHGFGLPFGLWLRSHAPLRELAHDCLGSLRGRQIVSPAFLDRLVRLHREEHALYYGEFIWVLMVLEQWLQARAGPAMSRIEFPDQTRRTRSVTGDFA